MAEQDPKNWNEEDKNLKQKIVDDSYRNYFQLLVVSLVLTGVALTMAILNAVGGKKTLSIVCFVYAGCSAANVCWPMAMKCAKTRHYFLFGVSTVALFTFILLTGGVSGISAMWLLLLPASGITLLGRAKGSAMCAAMFAVLVFLFWFPLGGKLLFYDYPADFCIRFPIVYVVFFFVGFWFEDMRSKTQTELVSVKNRMKEISETDALTGLKNRYWFNRKIARKYNGRQTDGDSVMLLWDIDLFKNLNDTYGHAAGDCVLVRHAEELKNVFPKSALYCRWGGEEFLAFLPDCGREEGIAVCETLQEKLSSVKFRAKTEAGSGRRSASAGSFYRKGRNSVLRNCLRRATALFTNRKTTAETVSLSAMRTGKTVTGKAARPRKKDVRIKQNKILYKLLNDIF